MPRQRKSIFVHPDAFTNQVIASELLSEEEHLHVNRLCADGSERSVWEFTPRDADRLVRLMMMEGTRMEFFREGPKRHLVSLSLELTSQGLVFS